MALTLMSDERTELERRAMSRTIRAEDAKRAKVILMLADGTSYSTIEATLWCYRDYINRWRRRFVARRLDGLRSDHKGQKPRVLTPALEARILAKTQQRPPDGSTHWSTRRLARVLNIHHNHVQTVWTRAGLQPHRFERYMRSDDPDFEPKAADVIGLYLNPPQHAAVFAADEKTAIQALDRLDPLLPLSPGRAERHGFEYFRHGTLSLFAALNTQTGQVLGQTVQRHTSDAFAKQNRERRLARADAEDRRLRDSTQAVPRILSRPESVASFVRRAGAGGLGSAHPGGRSAGQNYAHADRGRQAATG